MVSLNPPMTDGSTVFISRTDAGKKLGTRLFPLKDTDPLVLARPTGDMAVAVQIARSLEAQLDVCAGKKLRSPANEKLSIGTVLEAGLTSLKDEIIRILDIPPLHVEEERQLRLGEIQEEMGGFRDQHPRIPIEDRTVVVAVEGILHGGSIKPRLKALGTAEPRSLILAVPIAPQITLRNLRPLVDDIVPLHEQAGYFPRICDFYDRPPHSGEQSIYRQITFRKGTFSFLMGLHYMLARDRSDSSRSAETYLHTLLTPGDDRVLVVHVVEPIPSFYAGESIDPHSVSGALMERGEQIVSESASRLSRAGFHVDTEVEQGRAGPTLCRLATSREIDGIVIGRQGRGAVRELLLGSVSQYVVHHAPCPVTLVPSPENER